MDCAVSHVEPAQAQPPAQGDSITHRLRVEHGDLVQRFEAIRLACRQAQGAADARQACLEIRQQLSELLAAYVRHVGFEDSLMMRKMAVDARARIIAEQYSRETLAQRNAFMNFGRHYAVPAAIRGDLQQFMADANEQFGVLEEHMHAQERELFAEYERLHAPR